MSRLRSDPESVLRDAAPLRLLALVALPAGCTPGNPNHDGTLAHSRLDGFNDPHIDNHRADSPSFWRRQRERMFSELAHDDPSRVQSVEPDTQSLHASRDDVALLRHNHHDRLDRGTAHALPAQPGGPPLFVVPLGGERFGGFDLALVPVGCCGSRWFHACMHVDADEAVRIHLDTKSRLSLGIHWCAFRLCDEPIHAPLDELPRARARHGVHEEAFVLFRPGETRVLGRAGP